MTITLWNLFEASLLCLNAVCILHEERFLVKIGWSAKSPTAGGFGESPTAKAQILNLIHSIRTVARKRICKLLITEPHIVQDVVTDIVLGYLRNILVDNSKLLQANQIISPIVVCSQFLLKNYPTLRTLRAVIVEMTIPKQFVRRSTWKCDKDICKSLKPIIHRYIPSTKPLCPHCASTLVEIASARDYGTHTFIKTVDPIFLTLTSSNVRTVSQFTLAHVEDDRDCEQELELGKELLITGVQKNDIFEIWGCKNVEYVMAQVGSMAKINHMRKRYVVSPWAFVQILANEIGGNVYPPDTYNHLRMGVLLSLASTNSSKPIPILAVSADVHAAEQIMFQAAKLSQRCVRPCMPTLLGGNVKEGWKKAGSMLLASKGVCYLGNWESYTGHKGQAIKKAVETGVMVLDNMNSVNLRAAVWTCCADSGKKKDQEQLLTLVKVFGFAWKLEDNSDMLNDVCDFILEGRRTYKPQVSTDELRNYLDAVNAIRVTLSNGAMDLLKQYFVCARHARGGDLPLSSLDPLTAMTEAHARLNQRSMAWPEDALVALYLCEIALGPCHLLKPPPSEIWEFGNWLKENVLSLVPSTLLQLQQ